MAAKSMKKPARLSAMALAANALRQDAMDREEGALLGSEDDLIARYGVSRPTLRQAAALISQENLLRVKRGVGGGYFAARPSTRTVAHVAAVYLRTLKTEVWEVIEAFAPIRVALARMAASSDNAAIRERLEQFVSAEMDRGPDQRYRDFLKTEREFGLLLGELGENRVMALFMEILFDFSAMLDPGDDIYVGRPDRVREYRGRRNQLAVALLEKDEELAAVAARRCSLNSNEWLQIGPDDMSRQMFTGMSPKDATLPRQANGVGGR